MKKEEPELIEQNTHSQSLFPPNVFALLLATCCCWWSACKEQEAGLEETGPEASVSNQNIPSLYIGCSFET